ncbi:MAG TPA: MlaD family protein [Solirubrobacteraceae bacterium]|jgi:virulence factor Mce-like protein|nr:MlaD family protein [Solirubrobacteraceae bacterium]
MRRHPARVSNLQAAVAAIVVIGIACYFVFGGPVPFSGSGYRLRAVFTANTELHIPSPVRIAGVDVGEVTSVRHISGSRSAGVVTMQIDRQGLPIHSDATAQIRSRIFLEGNFYVALNPGTPEAPVLHSGSTLPAANTSGPVQLDRILSQLNAPARTSLQRLLRGLGGALNGSSGQTGGQALNRALNYSTQAFTASAIVNQALLGERPHDLSGTVAGSAAVLRALSSSPSQLTGLVDTFQRTMGALAARQGALSASVAALPGLLRSTNAADTALDGSYANTQSFAGEILPGIRQLGPTIDAALPWLGQLTALVSRRELGGLLTDLTPAVQNTSATVRASVGLVRRSDQLARCLVHNVIPTGNQVISDPPVGDGRKVYQELFQGAVGLAGAGQNFDGNGRYLRSTVGGGGTLVQTPTLPTNGPLFGNAVLAPLGSRPAFAAKAPPLHSGTSCFRNPVTDLNSAATGVGP